MKHARSNTFRDTAHRGKQLRQPRVDQPTNDDIQQVDTCSRPTVAGLRESVTTPSFEAHSNWACAWAGVRLNALF